MDVRKILWKDVDWMHLGQDRDQWRTLVSTVTHTYIHTYIHSFIPWILKFVMATK